MQQTYDAAEHVQRMCSGPGVRTISASAHGSGGKEFILNAVGIINPSVATAKRVATAGESFPNAMIDLVADPSDSSRLKLLLWDGTNAKVAPRIKYRCCTYEPVALHPAVVRGVRWPTFCSACGSTRELFDRILSLITEKCGIAEQPARMMVYFIFSTWFPDRLALAPGLAIVGSAVGEAIQLLRFLHCVCRRPILLGGMSQPNLMSLPLSVYPTLLLDRPMLTRPLQTFLSASNRRGFLAVNRGKKFRRLLSEGSIFWRR